MSVISISRTSSIRDFGRERHAAGERHDVVSLLDAVAQRPLLVRGEPLRGAVDARPPRDDTSSIGDAMRVSFE